jgi:hypothetical protein
MSAQSSVGQTVGAHHDQRRSPAGVLRDGSGLQLEVGKGGPGPGATDTMPVTQTAVWRVRGRAVDLKQSAVGAVLARDVKLYQGAGAVLAGGKVSVEQSVGQWLVGGLVQARQVFAVAVIAGKVEGQVRCLFDARGAFAFGAGAALVTGLLRVLARRK